MKITLEVLANNVLIHLWVALRKTVIISLTISSSFNELKLLNVRIFNYWK